MKRYILHGLAALVLSSTAGCVSPEDKANAARKADLDLEQAELIVDGDCTATRKALDAWYEKNKDEADKLDGWWETKSDGEKDSLMGEHKDKRSKTHKATITSTIRCGFVPMNSRRQ